MLFWNGESQKDFKNLQKLSSTSSEHSVATITEIENRCLLEFPVGVDRDQWY